MDGRREGSERHGNEFTMLETELVMDFDNLIVKSLAL